MTLGLDDQSFRLSLPPGKDEMHFAEFPIALLTDRVPKGQKSIKFEDQIFDERRKKLVIRRRIIEGSEEYGLPTATDDAVILALIQLSKQKTNFSSREVEFSRLELIKLLGWPNEGKSYERIKLSLLRITNVTYNYDNAWWDARQKAWTTRAFHIIDSVEINDSRAASGQQGLFASRIVWGDAVFESFQSGYLRNIDFQLCMRLEHPTALRMYRFLGKRFHFKPELTFALKEFAYDHIGLGRNYEGGTQIARKLQPAIAELEEAGFLEPLAYQERFAKKGREWSIRFTHKTPSLVVETPVEGTAVENTCAPLPAELVKRGVTRSKADELIARYPPDVIQEKLDVFDWLYVQQDKRVARNPAGYLVKSVEDDYAAPKGFISKAEQQRLVAANAEKSRKAAKERQAKQGAVERERADVEAITAYWVSLDEAERAEVDAAALAATDPATMGLATGSLKRLGLSIARNQHIRKLLVANGTLPSAVE